MAGPFPQLELPTDYRKLSTHYRRKIREEYQRRQNNLCSHCERSLHADPPDNIKLARINWPAFPPGFLNNPVHLHHNHQTGMTIGAVHAMCNAWLWQYRGE